MAGIDGDFGSDSSGSDWEEGVENEFASIQAECLFCNTVLEDPISIFDHCQKQHKFDIQQFGIKHSLDAINYIKLINYIRKMNQMPEDLYSMSVINPKWVDDIFMIPVIPDDPLLIFDFESFLEERTPQVKVTDKGDVIEVPKLHYYAVLKQLVQCQTQLQDALDDMEKMRITTKELLISEEDSASKTWVVAGAVGMLSPEDDTSYFSTYSHYSIHHEMLQDQVRTTAYRQAVLSNPDAFRGASVLDVGCGTSILSMFAATAGASAVVAIDQSDIVYQAMDIIRENKLENTIHIVKGRLEDVDLPIEKTDIIISEWMGYFLLFEGMLDTVIHARDKYLAPSGRLFPNRCTMHLVGLCDLEMHSKYVSFWEDIYGYKMSCMKRDVVGEAIVTVVQPETVCTEAVLIKEFDLLSCSVQDTEFSASFQLTMTEDGPVTAVGGYFDCHFDSDLKNPVCLSTSPLSEPTHWKQTVFLLMDPLHIGKGSTVDGKITCRRNRKDLRSISVMIILGNSSQTYVFS